MKKSHEKYLIFFTTIVILIIFRETALSHINFCTFKLTNKTNCHYLEKTLFFDLKNEEKNKNNMLLRNQAYILLYDNDTILNSPGKGKPMIWTIKKFEMDNGVTPLYKSLCFDSEVVCKSNFTLTKSANNRMRYIECNFNALIRISGHTKIIGLSSISNNKKIVSDYIGKITKENILKILQELDIKYTPTL